MLLFVRVTAFGALEEVNVPASLPPVVLVFCALILSLVDVEGVKVGVDNVVRKGEVEIAVCQNEVIGVVLAETIDVLLVVVVVINEESELELSVITIGVDGAGVVMFEKREVEGDDFTEVIEVVASVSWELLVRL